MEMEVKSASLQDQGQLACQTLLELIYQDVHGQKVLKVHYFLIYYLQTHKSNHSNERFPDK